MCIETEMPEAAVVLGKDRVYGRIIDLQDFLFRVASVMSRDSLAQSAGNCRAISLKDNVKVITYRSAKL